jgi:hypothetical protein
MFKVLLTVLHSAIDRDFPQNNLACEVTRRRSASLAVVAPNSMRSAIHVGNGEGCDAKKQGNSVLAIDYPGRLRAPFKDGWAQAIISREDALVAAAEIEQLWTALRMFLDRTEGVTLPDPTMGMNSYPSSRPSK